MAQINYYLYFKHQKLNFLEEKLMKKLFSYMNKLSALLVILGVFTSAVYAQSGIILPHHTL